jgi:DNA-binding transcriptional ArsR family regulator
MAGFANARRERVLIERLGDEVVLYDRDADVAHCLQSAAAAVWEHADGSRSDAQIAAATGLEEREVSVALDELREAGLLETPADSEPGQTRREATKRILRAGALAAAAPLIYTVAIAPAAAMASEGFCANPETLTPCYGMGSTEAAALAAGNAQCNSECPVCDGGNVLQVAPPPQPQEWIVAGICTD